MTGNTGDDDCIRPRIARFTDHPDSPNCPIARFPRQPIGAYISVSSFSSGTFPGSFG